MELRDSESRNDTLFLRGRDAELPLRELFTSDLTRLFGSSLSSGAGRYVGPEQMDSIRVTYYHKGLKSGYLAGTALSDEAKKEYVKKIRSAGNVQAPKEWSRDDDTARNQQISYVIDLATTALKLHIIKPE